MFEGIKTRPLFDDRWKVACANVEGTSDAAASRAEDERRIA